VLLHDDEEVSLITYLHTVREHWDSVVAVKEAILLDQPGIARENWNEIPEEDAYILYRAPSKGSVLTTQERAYMKSNRWSETL